MRSLKKQTLFRAYTFWLTSIIISVCNSIPSFIIGIIPCHSGGGTIHRVRATGGKDGGFYIESTALE